MTTTTNIDNTKKPGAIKISIEIKLDTKEAVALFYGRKETDDVNRIIGLKGFSEKVKYINNAAHNDDPYADFFLLEIESTLTETKTTLIRWQENLTKLAFAGSLLKVNQGSSIKPVQLETSFASVYANIALDLLKRADNLLLTVHAFKHTGLMSRIEANNEVNKVNKLLRKTFLSADHYKFFSVNRMDVKHKTARYKQAHIAMRFTEELPEGIIDKTIRAEHAPNIILSPDEVFRKPKKVDEAEKDETKKIKDKK